MKPLKHVGKIKNTGAKVLVVFRTLPGESGSALVVQTAQLPDAQHDSIMSVLESDAAQEAFELGEILHVRPFPDGRPMLRALAADSRLQKIATDLIVMTPTPASEIQLDQLNLLIAEQKNCAVDDLCNFVKGAPGNPETSDVKETKKIETETLSAADDKVLSNEDLAKSYRSQADSLYKEAARLRKQADELDPPKKKATSKLEVSA